MKQLGTIYLLHFSEAFKQAQRFVDYTTSLERRLSEHAHWGDKSDTYHR